MDIQGKNIVVTGGGNGIGRALVHRFAAEGARSVVVADHDLPSAEAVVREVGPTARAWQFDAGSEADVNGLIAHANSTAGSIDVYVSNAGVTGPAAGPEAPNDVWDALWRIHVMSYVWASRALLPQMIEAGGGYLVNTSSAAGLLTQPSALVYSVTKHAAVALAEWLAFNYAKDGIKVSCVCPQAVSTRMNDRAMAQTPGAAKVQSAAGVLTPEQVAEDVVAGMREERFLILPHKAVADRMALRGADHEAWLASLRAMIGEAAKTSPANAPGAP